MSERKIDWARVKPTPQTGFGQLQKFRREHPDGPTKARRMPAPPTAPSEELMRLLSTATTAAEKAEAVHRLEQRRDELTRLIGIARSPVARLVAGRELQSVKAALAGG